MHSAPIYLQSQQSIMHTWMALALPTVILLATTSGYTLLLVQPTPVSVQPGLFPALVTTVLPHHRLWEITITMKQPIMMIPLLCH
jgi:hypothetical protein